MGLFDDFKEVSHQQWHDKIIADLKGKDYNENLVWESMDGISVQPFYSQENLEKNISKTFVLNSTHSSIENRGIITINSIEEANKKALYLLERGANSIQFVNEIDSQNDFDTLLKGIDIEIIHLHFYNPNPNQTLNFLTSFCEKRNIKPINLKGSISYDYLGELLIRGNWNTGQHEDLSDIFAISKVPNPFKTISVNGLYFNNAGSTIIQELAFSFCQAVEYLNYLTDNNLDVKNISNKFVFNFGISSNYFFEIAKIRAAKILWKLILNQYNVSDTPIYINSVSTFTNFSCFDEHNNILRTTTEAMSAIIGGSNSIYVLPFDKLLGTSPKSSDRIAINILHILKEEAFLDKVSDASKGSYYIESLTDEMVEKSLQLFKEIEQKGGFLANIKNGFIQESIHLVAKQKQEGYDSCEKTLLGVNKHRDTTSTKIIPMTKIKKSNGNGLIPTLQLVRFAEEIETREFFQNV